MESNVTKRLKEQYKGISNNEAVKPYKKNVKRKIEKSQATDKLLDKYGKKAERIDISLGSKKLLSNPKAKITSRDLLRELKKQGNYSMVRELERKEVVPDNRSLFFNEEFRRESKKGRRWLS